MRFIAEHADRVSVDGLRWGVEPICVVLCDQGTPIAPSTYYDTHRRGPSRKAVRDAQLKWEIARVYEENLRCLWRAQGVAGAEPRGHLRGAVHGGTTDAPARSDRRAPGRGPYRTTVADPAQPARRTWSGASSPRVDRMPPG